jgi:phage gpG-like protein
MIRIEVNLPHGLPKKIARLGENVKKRLAVGIDRATNRLSNEIKINLSKGGGVSRKGKNPGQHLRVQSGDLRSSWIARPATLVGDAVEGHVSTSTVYAAIHEFGGTIIHHARSFLRGFKFVRPTPRSRRVRQSTGSLSQGATRSSWTIRIPQRPYVNPALKKVGGKMTEDVLNAFMGPAK